MKANLHTVNTPKGKGPFHGNDIRLTIGMIVKNEEKTLDKCLSSLKPLLEAIPSELIITDTGSTDKTVEIAKKYTDHILNFEWCGDFSAARNTGLSIARGEWFMFIDGDEWFEDITEIIDFFNSGECDQYWTATYIQRNYNDVAGKTFTDFYACRIFRRYQGIHFKNKVHEDIARVVPTKYFESFVHHYGYMFLNDEERDKKGNRNLEPLLDELKEDPNDLKAYSQIVGQFLSFREYEKAIDYAKQGLKIEEKFPDRFRYYCIFKSMIDAYVNVHKYQDAIDEIDQVLETDKKLEIVHLDLFRYGQQASIRLKKFEKSIEYGKMYLELYQKYIANELDKTILMFTVVYYCQPCYQQQVLMDMCWSYMALGKPEEALKCLNQIDFSTDAVINCFSICFSLAQETSNWDIVKDFYIKILKLDEPEKKFSFIEYCERFLHNHSDLKLSVMSCIGDSDTDDDYCSLNRLRMAEQQDDKKAAHQILDLFVQKSFALDFHFSDVLYYAMKDKINLVPYLLKVDTDDLSAMAVNMQKQHRTDFINTVMDYFQAYSYENVKGRYWSISLLEKAVLQWDKSDDDEQYIRLFDIYSRQFAQYVRLIYRTEMFGASNFVALPRACRFAYYMGEAYHSKDEGDGAGYLASLRKALKEYPIMEKPVKIILANFEAEKNMQEAKAEEFQKLAKQVKQKIEDLILQGDMRQAGQITLQLAKLMPDDMDVQKYQKLTNTEPTMPELASRLPQ